LESSSENDFETEVISNYKMIFDINSIYIDIKKKLGKKIYDGFVFDKSIKSTYNS
jgi:hypothetical protein